MFSHPSESCGGIMKCSVYLPPKAEVEKVPVLYWLSGLTCTHENFITKAGAQQAASELGLMLIVRIRVHGKPASRERRRITT